MANERAFRRMKCPFILCQAVVRVLPAPVMGGTNPQRDIVPQHEFQHPDVSERRSCPASLMYVPLSQASVTRLAGQMLSFVNLIRDSQAKVAGERSTGDNKSQPVAGSGRDQLHLNDPAWQRGGREDPDIETQGDIQPRQTGSSDMATRAELAALINQAGQYENEARGAIDKAVEELPRLVALAFERMRNALAIYASILADGDSERISTAVNAVAQAQTELETAVHLFDLTALQAQRNIDVATESNQEFIAALFSI